MKSGTLIAAIALCVMSCAGAAAETAAQDAKGVAQAVGERIEMLDWADPERADLVLTTAQAGLERHAPDPQLLEVQGMVYTDVHRDADAEATIARLDAMVARGYKPARVADHYVRAYWLYQHNQYLQASSELEQIDPRAIVGNGERYRVSVLRGNTLRMLGRPETALPYLEAGLDIAQALQDDLRSLHAMLWLARIYTNTGNLDRAAAQLEVARHLAVERDDETALVEVEDSTAVIDDRRGEHLAERRASELALDHAKRAGSNKWLAYALINLGNSYLSTHDYGESLKYSKQALPLVAKLHESRDEPVIAFNEGLAYIGLGNIKLGEKLAESAIAEAIGGNNFLDARELLREYAGSLEQAGYLMMSIQVHHRYDDLNDKSMNATRQRTFLELSAKFDDERRARELELLRRDKALDESKMGAQRLRQQFVLAGAALVTCLCAALIWAFIRVRKVNERLRYTSERDALTGLRNRRYFNEHLLSVGTRPVGGCVLLADLDHFKRINDTLGHPAGDAVLATVSHRLSAALRESDMLVRWGGEEFLAVLEPITPEQANTAVERLLRAVRRDPILWNGHSIECTISIGYGCFPMAGASADISLDSAIKLVDKALYEAKRRGRDRACLISTVRAQDERELTDISAAFESATTDHRVELVERGAVAQAA